VEILLRKGFTAKDYGLQTIGYQQIIRYLQNELKQEEMIEIWLNKECQYAKRQLTFMKTNPQIIWYNVDQTNITTIYSSIDLLINKYANDY
jgi:tRNA dimethylallyltransferase